MESLPFPDACFDAVISLDVLSDARVGDPVTAARELRRVLRPGGLLVANLPAYAWLRSGHDDVAQTARRTTARAARRMLADAGFGPVRVTYRIALLFVPAAVRRILGRGSEQTDVAPVAPALNRGLLAVMGAEDAIGRRVPLPFGLSVFITAVAR